MIKNQNLPITRITISLLACIMLGLTGCASNSNLEGLEDGTYVGIAEGTLIAIEPGTLREEDGTFVIDNDTPNQSLLGRQCEGARVSGVWGSYCNSCSNCKRSNPYPGMVRMVCDCKRHNGRRLNTAIEYKKCPQQQVYNGDGLLRCGNG